MELRRSRTLTARWHEGALTVEDYLAEPGDEGRTGVEVDGTALDILGHFDDWTDPEAVLGKLDGYDADSVRVAIKDLAELGLLHGRDEVEREDKLTDAWRHWGEAARYFHFATKDVSYVTEENGADTGRDELVSELLEEGPPPSVFGRRAGGPKFRLPRSFVPLDRSFSDVLVSRRTTREFSDEPVGLREFSTVLHYAFGPMYFIDVPNFGQLMMRTSPCGGSRHESEAYVAVRNVESVPSGLYRYCPEDHSLELLDNDVDLDRVGFEQNMVTSSGFVILLTIDIYRAMYKYRNSRILRTILLNAGHLAQTFALCATAVGLGPFQTDAFRDSELEEALGIDGISETAVYVFGAGVPAVRRDGKPSFPIAAPRS
ncbi:SagB/ThcOx family dehydrogenase [Streptomyces sp. NPDC006482]|uniref:SagB/ThcOx family dehydrogenase n=1 Tax=unclassified Streptomyces TaxID=2593676 RepID=UPI002256F54C|nr:SagB/ThcOx family dehydrogenase [Streptomyces sp. NBC_00094]MCX5390541.1 SagB/ThcOx family dehydrogenase [Streptomyces sp. NBC_00094]